MLDTREPVTISIISGTDKKATVRWPTEEELAGRVKRMKAVRRDVGRNFSEFDIINLEEVEADLFQKIRIDKDGDVFDEYEATDVMNRLLKADALETHRNGNNSYEVQIAVYGDREVKHVLRMPTQKDVIEYRRESMRTLQGRRFQEVRMSLDPVIRLWSKLLLSTEGYADGCDIPVVHRERALLEIMDAIQNMDAEDGSRPER